MTFRAAEAYSGTYSSISSPVDARGRGGGDLFCLGWEWEWAGRNEGIPAFLRDIRGTRCIRAPGARGRITIYFQAPRLQSASEKKEKEVAGGGGHKIVSRTWLHPIWREEDEEPATTPRSARRFRSENVARAREGLGKVGG
jgi:hypothetical protein